MKIAKVTDVLAFVLANGEFTETILFADDEIEQLKPEERAAADAVLKHVEGCYVEILSECRVAFLQQVKGTSLEANRKTLELNKTRASTMWKRGSTQVPLLIRSSWIAWVTFGFWPTAEASRPIKLAAHLSVQHRFFSELQDAVKAAGAELKPVSTGHAVDGLLPKEGQSFSELALEIAKQTIPIASQLYTRLVAHSATS